MSTILMHTFYMCACRYTGLPWVWWLCESGSIFVEWGAQLLPHSNPGELTKKFGSTFACVVFCFDGYLYLAVHDTFTHSFLLLLPTSFHLGSWVSTTWLWTPSLSVQVSFTSMFHETMCEPLNDIFCHLIWVCECLQHSCGYHFLVAASLQKHFDHIFSCLSCTRVTKERYQIGLLEGSLRSFSLVTLALSTSFSVCW